MDNSLLVYTTDNTLFHYLVVPTADTIKLHLAGSISFRGVIANPNAVRALSWMIPSGQKRRFLWMPRGANILNHFFLLVCRTGRSSGRPRRGDGPDDGRGRVGIAQA